MGFPNTSKGSTEEQDGQSNLIQPFDSPVNSPREFIVQTSAERARARAKEPWPSGISPRETLRRKSDHFFDSTSIGTARQLDVGPTIRNDTKRDPWFALMNNRPRANYDIRHRSPTPPSHPAIPTTSLRRCHSCHRAESPRWRNSPDGSQTLCNECGFHYAELTRKLSQDRLQCTRVLRCSKSKKGQGESMDDMAAVSRPCVRRRSKSKI